VLRPPLIYLITSRLAFRQRPEKQSEQGSNFARAATASNPWDSQLAAIRIAARAGCQLIQIREKDLGARQLGAFVRAAISVARPRGARVLVNDRLDVALAAGADGVHLRTSSLPVGEVRKIVGGKRPGEFLIGVSTHSLAEARVAESGGADFIVFGPVSPPLSKKIEGPATGLKSLAEVCHAVRIPVLGLGGIQMDNAAVVLNSGAAGVAAISLFSDLNSLESNVGRLLSLNEPG